MTIATRIRTSKRQSILRRTLPALLAIAAAAGSLGFSSAYAIDMTAADSRYDNLTAFNPANARTYSFTAGTSAADTLLTVTDGPNILGTTASIREATEDSTVSVNWRNRAYVEAVAAHPLLPSWAAFVCSDVMDVEGVKGIYVVQMQYSTKVERAEDEAIDPTKGHLYLGWLDFAGNSPEWRNAVDCNKGQGDPTKVQMNYQGTYATFRQNHPGDPLGDLLGSWGVDTETDTVWAVVDNNGQFVVVPEPATISMLGGGAGVALLGLIIRRRRSRTPRKPQAAAVQAGGVC